MALSDGPEEIVEDSSCWSRPIESISSRTSWQSIRQLIAGRSVTGLIFFALLVPAVANLMDKVPEVIAVRPFSSEPPIKVQMTLPFSWVAVYISALGFLISRVIYNIRCPSFLAAYESPAGAIQAQLTPQVVGDFVATYLSSYYRNQLPNYDATESRMLRRLLRQMRAGSIDIDQFWRQSSAEYRSGYVGVLLADTIDFSAFRVDERGIYVLPELGPYAPMGDIHVSKERFLQHLCWDLMRLQEIAFPRTRVFVGVVLLCSTLLAGSQIVLGAMAVISTLNW